MTIIEAFAVVMSGFVIVGGCFWIAHWIEGRPWPKDMSIGFKARPPYEE